MAWQGNRADNKEDARESDAGAGESIGQYFCDFSSEQLVSRRYFHVSQV